MNLSIGDKFKLNGTQTWATPAVSLEVDEPQLGRVHLRVRALIQYSDLVAYEDLQVRNMVIKPPHPSSSPNFRGIEGGCGAIAIYFLARLLCSRPRSQCFYFKHLQVLIGKRRLYPHD